MTVAAFSEEKNSSAYLLNGHHHLDGVQAVETEVVGEVRNTVDLMVEICQYERSIDVSSDNSRPIAEGQQRAYCGVKTDLARVGNL